MSSSRHSSNSASRSSIHGRFEPIHNKTGHRESTFERNRSSLVTTSDHRTTFGASLRQSTIGEFAQACPFKDDGNIVAWCSFLYGLAVTNPYNFITFSLPFLAEKMPDYPIAYVVTFAVNGVMVLVVLVCLAWP